MMLTRTRLTLIALIGLLAIIGIACSAALSGDDGNGDPAIEPQQGFGETDTNSQFLGSDGLPGFPPEESEMARLEGRSASDALPNADDSPAVDPQLQNLLNRKIVQSTSVDIRVEEVGRDFQEIIRIANAAGGFVASSTFSNVDDRQVADITIRVPSERYQDVLAQIRGMGEVTTESSDANDVTEEYTDLQARLRTLEATERQYLELLGQANEISDILLVQDRLDFVRGQIEQVQGRINLLEHLTDLATITIHLRPLAGEAPLDDGGGLDPLQAAAGAWERSLDTLRGLATGVLVVAAFSWWLLPPLAAMAVAGRWWLGRQHGVAKETST